MESCSEKCQECHAERSAAGFEYGVWREAFRMMTTTLLSLLIPLSFLLLARLSTAHYLLEVAGVPPLAPPEFFFLFSTNSAILYFLLSLVSVSSFVHGLTGKVTFLSCSSEQSPVRPSLYIAWILLCTLQVCVGLGIEGSIAAGIDGSGFKRDTSMLSKVIFFLGLHETMRFWSRSVVKPVVDDTVLGFFKEERWAERVTMAMSFGFLWWWRLRDEIDSVVVVAQLKREVVAGGVGVVDFLGWWLYYLTVSIGTIRIMRGFIWLGMVVLSRKIHEEDSTSDYQEIDEQV